MSFKLSTIFASLVIWRIGNHCIHSHQDNTVFIYLGSVLTQIADHHLPKEMWEITRTEEDEDKIFAVILAGKGGVYTFITQYGPKIDNKETGSS